MNPLGVCFGGDLCYQCAVCFFGVYVCASNVADINRPPPISLSSAYYERFFVLCACVYERCGSVLYLCRSDIPARMFEFKIFASEQQRRLVRNMCVCFSTVAILRVIAQIERARGKNRDGVLGCLSIGADDFVCRSGIIRN